MDEIEFRRIYNEAVTCVDSEPRKAALLTLQLIDYLDERITELQEQEDEDE